jgi:predicted DsbA family dithiol-disulfide isomerase
MRLGVASLKMSVLDDEREAAVLGVRGVPAFFANQKAALTGVQAVDKLKKLIEHVRV